MRLFVAFVENGGIIVLSAVFIDRFILRPRNWVWHLCRSTRDVYAALTIVLTNKHTTMGTCTTTTTIDNMYDFL